MVTHVVLIKLTDQGVKDIKSAPQRYQQATKAYEAMGGKIISFYATMGEYDYVAVSEAPSDEVAMTFAMALASGGSVRTTALKAFAPEQFAEMVKKLS